MTNASSLSASAAPRISVVVPVRNEAGNLAPLIGEIARAMSALAPFEIIYVNDGSSDGTAAELRTLAEQFPYLRHLDHAVSCGQSAAVRSGATFARAPIVVTLDGDGQNDPAFLPALVAAIERDPRNAAAYYNRGYAWKLKGDRAQALADYLEATRLDPSVGTALVTPPGS